MIVAGLASCQSSAVAAFAGNVQVIAYPDSGKTEVVACTVVNLLTPASVGGDGCTPAITVAFTFTEKAAAEGIAKGFARISGFDASRRERIARVDSST